MITSKQCISCHKTKKVSNFYIHRDNKPGYGLDNSCRDCSRKMSVTLAGLKEYCNLNSRVFDNDLFKIATESATKKYENDIEFNSLSEEKRESFLFTKIRNIYFSQQSQTQFYKYIDDEESPTLLEKDIEDGAEYIEKEDREKKIHSTEWQGMYTRVQLDYLQSYFSDSFGDFTIVTRNHRDYLYKIAKASLAMDEAFNDMLNGISGAEKRYAAAKTVFDTLSQSAKFSEKTRSANDVAGLSSLSEVVKQLEKTGFLQKNRVYKKDDIDKIGDNFRHTITSVGGSF